MKGLMLLPLPTPCPFHFCSWHYSFVKNLISVPNARFHACWYLPRLLFPPFFSTQMERWVLGTYTLLNRENCAYVTILLMCLYLLQPTFGCYPPCTNKNSFFRCKNCYTSPRWMVIVLQMISITCGSQMKTHTTKLNGDRLAKASASHAHSSQWYSSYNIYTLLSINAVEFCKMPLP